MTLRNFTLIYICSFLFAALAFSQHALDLSNNRGENTFRFPRTDLSLDTTGLNLTLLKDQNILFNASDQTLLAAEQLETSLEDYESLVWELPSLESTFFEQKVHFKQFRGKLTYGSMKINGDEKHLWVFYLGKEDLVIRMVGIYSPELHSKYSAAFEKAIKSSFIIQKGEFSVYENLPYYLDENKFPYFERGSIMSQYTLFMREVDGFRRVMMLKYIPSVDEVNLEIIQINYDDAEIYRVGNKEIILNISQDEKILEVKAHIKLDNRLIIMRCNSSSKDKNALDEFREMAKSVEFRRN